MTTRTDTAVRVVGTRIPLRNKFRELWDRRELIGSLVRKELKVKYKDSSLGFLWSMLNPALYLVVFYVVFTFFLPNDIPQFYLYLLCGLLPYNFLVMGLTTSTGSVVANGSLVKKIYFPREILPISTVGAALVHLGLQWIVLLLVIIGTRSPITADIWLVLPATLVVVILVSGLAVFLSALNVRARDTQHLLELVLLAWFWMTPIVYRVTLLQERAPDWMFRLYLLLNPMTPVVLAYQRGIYGTERVITGSTAPVVPSEPIGWYLWHLGFVGLLGIVIFFVAFRVFAHLEQNFAEEL